MVTAGLAVALVTVGGVTICLAIVRPFLVGRQLLDVPNHRSAHTKPTVRGGGAGIVAGLLIGLACCGLLLSDPEVQRPGIVAVGVTVTALAVVGLIEDVRGLKVGSRLIAQASILLITAAGAVLVAGAPVTLALPAVLAGVFYVNAANFMDGVNGISSLHGGVVGTHFVVVGFASGAPDLMLAAVAVGAAFLSFLPWNAPRARIFMGDVGSYALGGAVWAIAVWSVLLGVPWFTVVAPLLVYSTDVAVTLLRRVSHGAPLAVAHREHVYQLVHGLTRSHGRAAALATASTLACSGLGLWSWFVPEVLGWAVAATGAVLAIYVASPWLIGRHVALATVPDRAAR